MNTKIAELVKQAKVPAALSNSVAIEKYTELLITECIKILITGEGNDNTSDAIWDLEVLGVDVGKVVNKIHSVARQLDDENNNPEISM